MKHTRGDNPIYDILTNRDGTTVYHYTGGAGRPLFFVLDPVQQLAQGVNLPPCYPVVSVSSPSGPLWMRLPGNSEGGTQQLHSRFHIAAPVTSQNFAAIGKLGAQVTAADVPVSPHRFHAQLDVELPGARVEESPRTQQPRRRRRTRGGATAKRGRGCLSFFGLGRKPRGRKRV